MKNILLLLFITLLSFAAYSAKITDNELTVGKAGSDFQMIHKDGGYLKKESGSGSWFFSDDGATEKKFGSGSGSGGGGQNFFIDNPDAGSGTNNWINTGVGTFTTFSVTPINGDASFRWDPATQNDVLRSDQVAIPEKFKGRACQIEFIYTGATDDLIKPQVVDGSNVKLVGATYRNQIDGTDFLKAKTTLVTRSIFFICPSTGTIAFEFNHTAVGNSASIDFDDVHIGELKGLVETTLPDEFSASFSGSLGAGMAKLTENVSGAITCTYNVTGIYNCSINLGLTVIPKITCTVTDSGAGGRICAIRSKTTSSFIVNVNSGDTITLENRDFDLDISKQGVDAKQSVQVYRSVPKVSENINNFSFKVDSAGVITDENTDWINGDCVVGGGIYACATVANTFTVIPNCQATYGSDNVVAANIKISPSITNGTINIFPTDAVGTSLNTSDKFTVNCQKAGVDFKMPTEQLILVNQVQSSFKNGVSDNSCSFNANATTNSNLCPSWISSTVKGATGFYTVNIASGIYADVPICNMTVVGTGRTCNFTSKTSTVLEIRCRDFSGTNTDDPFDLNCNGER